MKLRFKKLSEKAVIPSRATPGSAGMDICACLDEAVVLAPGEIKMIPTGLTADTDCTDVAMLIYPRSGLSTKFGVSLANCVGVVDSDYRGEWFIPLINHGKAPFTVEHGMRIAQLIPTKVIFPEVEICGSLTDTERGSGGFGSSGI
jgi:dUTP pyrophosphatase